MILHIVLYRFRADALEEQIQQCIQELKATIKTTELVSWYLSGYHIALPADTPVRDMVYDFASLWGFVDQKTLDEFSRHPAVAYCEATYIRPVVEKLAIINVNETTDTSWGSLETRRKSMSLEGKCALITGAASGIGQASAQVFAQAGARLALLDRDEAGLQMTAQLLGEDQQPLLLSVDVAQQQAVEQAIKAVQKQFGHLDVLMNNAAIVADWGLPADIPEPLWEEVVAVNLKGVVYTCRFAVPAMRTGSVIINTSSICGTARACATRAPYDIAKAGIVALTRDLAVAYGPHGIRANVLVPGFIDTPMSRRLVKGHEERAMAEVGRIPLRRLGLAEEVARVAAFLASDAASYVSGSVLFVDGGLSLV